MVTKEQFEAYKAVQHLGHYNMLSKDAMKETGLPKDVYFEIIMNYGKYAEMYK